MKTLLLIDLSGIFWQQWHATADKEIGAAFTASLATIHRYASRYDHVAIAIDCPPYKRKDLYPEYKAQRDKPAQDALDQFRRIRERLEADGYLLWGVPGYEADDVIATAATFASSEAYGMSVDILSADKDLTQLVGPRVCCISPRTGDRYDHAAVLEKFKVAPSLVGDLLALVGDKSDNVPGVPGVGIVKAAALLQQWGSLDEIQRAISDGDEAEELTPPSVRKALLENVGQLEVSRQLVRLTRDLPIAFQDLFAERKRATVADAAVNDDDLDDEPGFRMQQQEDETMSDETETEATEDSKPLPKPAETRPTEPAIIETTGQATSEETHIVRANGGSNDQWNYALEPSTPRGVWSLAKLLFSSRVFNVPNEEAALAIIMKGRSLGLDAVTSLTSFHFIEGKPTMSAQLLIGMIKASPKCEYFRLVKSERDVAIWETKRAGEPSPVSLDWTLDDATNAGLLRKTNSGRPSNWDKMPRTMLRWRCGVELGRAVYPDVISNLYTPEELE